MGLVKFVWYNPTTILENSKINRPVKETALVGTSRSSRPWTAEGTLTSSCTLIILYSSHSDPTLMLTLYW